MEKKDITLLGITFVAIFVIAIILRLFGVLESYQQFVAVLLSAAATYVIVDISTKSQARQQNKQQQELIKSQSANEEAKDKNIRIYEKKLDVYSKFNAMLWNLSDEKYFDKVKDMCMRELIFVISNDKIEALSECLKEVKLNFESQQAVEKSYAKITSILRKDLEGTDIPSNEILRVFTAISTEQQEEDTINHKNDANTEIALELRAEENSSDFKRVETQNIWERYKADEIKCWHFNAFDVAKQKGALEKGNMLLSLIEYDEDWRTKRLEQVRKGDVVFLFNRGGAGYVGLYRAIGTIILRIVDSKILMSKDGSPEIEITNVEAAKYDIYNAIEDGATLISAIEVEPVLIRSHSWNPIGTMRQTIVRPNEDNVWALLQYFDKDDK